MVAIISFAITLLITVIYKYTTNQDLMKSLKQDLKKSQEDLKKHRDDPKKMMEIQKKSMEKNMEYMRHSMKSTLYTMIPIIIIFGYLNSTLGYFPIMPNQEFSVMAEFKDTVNGEIVLNVDNLDMLSSPTQEIINNVATWKLSGDAGEYILQYEYNGNTYNQELLITTERKYRNPTLSVNKDGLKNLKIGNEKLIAMNLFGWKLGWLGTYIILSILFSTIVRKFMKVA